MPDAVSRSFNMTLSLYLDNDQLRVGGKHTKPNPEGTRATILSALRARLEPRAPKDAQGVDVYSDAKRRHAEQLKIQQKFPGTAALSEAIEPMFNDIADRERLGLIEDFLLAAGGSDEAGVSAERVLEFAFDSAPLQWTTEGASYAVPSSGVGQYAGTVRRFWYLHRNYSLSYHVSISFENYEHTPQTFLFFMALQKTLAPKEFALPKGSKDERITLARTPQLGVFDAIAVRDPKAAEGPLKFWLHVARTFNADFAELHNRLVGGTWTGSAWDDVLIHAPYVEVPGLRMPHVRGLYVIRDEVFLKLLLPRGAAGEPIARSEIVERDFFDLDLEQKLRQMASEAGSGTIKLDAPFWDWLSDSGGKALTPAFRALLTEREPGLDRSSLALILLFLAGFNQNIIDFVNQDTSEVLDSLDQIYPVSDGDIAQGFDVRYANPRALVEYAERIRSLDSGTSYIGTCPYAFLIYVLALHNEFLTKEYESAVEYGLLRMQRDVERRRVDWDSVLQTFFDLRNINAAEHARYVYDANIFRYDTERSVFERLMDIRSVALTFRKASESLEAAENLAHRVEERVDKRRADRLNDVLLVVGSFAVLQVLLELATQLREAGPDYASWGLAFTGFLVLVAVGLTAYAVVSLLIPVETRVRLRKRRAAARAAREAASEDAAP